MIPALHAVEASAAGYLCRMSRTQAQYVPFVDVAGSHTQTRSRAGLVALCCCLVLSPLWLLTMFDRGLWTPDEPREADIGWRMSLQQDHAIPNLAGRPFLEKPPLAYWASAAASAAFPDHPAALRLPNLLFAWIATMAIVMLAVAARGVLAGWIAGLAWGSFLLAVQVNSWLNTDAAMIAGVACALLGFYRGVESTDRTKLGWYALMHAGLACAFLAKGPAAWLVPVLASVSVLVIERKWRELRSWMFWAPAAISLGAISYWLLAVARAPDGAHALSVLLWENVAGRAMKLQNATAAAYAEGHRNYPLKYFVELPFYIAPWTFLFIAALRRAWRKVRTGNAQAWRFAMYTWALPFLALTFAHTARGIYAAPALLGVALLIAFWFTEAEPEMDRFERAMLKATFWFVSVIAFVLLACAAFMAITEPARTMSLPIFFTGVGLTFAALICARRALPLGEWRAQLAWMFGAFAASLVASVIVIFPTLDRWQDIASVIRRIDSDASTHPLVLFRPDETTLAIVDRVAEKHRDHIQIAASIQEGAALLSQPVQPVFLVQLAGKGDGPQFKKLRAWGIKTPHALPSPVIQELAAGLRLSVQGVYEVPQGRRYALLRVSPVPPVDYTREREFGNAFASSASSACQRQISAYPVVSCR